MTKQLVVGHTFQMTKMKLNEEKKVESARALSLSQRNSNARRNNAENDSLASKAIKACSVRTAVPFSS